MANIAVVPFQFGDWEMTKEVAVAPDEMLSGCSLYSFKLLDDSNMKLTEFIKAKKDAVAKETANAPTLIVTTRAQERAEREEQEQTDKQQQEDKAEPTPTKMLADEVAGEKGKSKLKRKCKHRVCSNEVEVVPKEVVQDEVLNGKEDEAEQN